MEKNKWIKAYLLNENMPAWQLRELVRPHKGKIVRLNILATAPAEEREMVLAAGWKTDERCNGWYIKKISAKIRNVRIESGDVTLRYLDVSKVWHPAVLAGFFPLPVFAVTHAWDAGANE